MGMQVLHLLMEGTEAQVELITEALVPAVALQMTKVLEVVVIPVVLGIQRMEMVEPGVLTIQEQTKAIRPHSKQEMAK
jgi:hypothetical protein